MEIELTVRAEEDLELLKHDLSGKWSRRITQSDRIIYQIKGDIVYVNSLKGHYSQTK